MYCPIIGPHWISFVPARLDLQVNTLSSVIYQLGVCIMRQIQTRRRSWTRLMILVQKLGKESPHTSLNSSGSFQDESLLCSRAYLRNITCIRCTAVAILVIRDYASHWWNQIWGLRPCQEASQEWMNSGKSTCSPGLFPSSSAERFRLQFLFADNNCLPFLQCSFVCHILQSSHKITNNDRHELTIRRVTSCKIFDDNKSNMYVSPHTY